MNLSSLFNAASPTADDSNITTSSASAIREALEDLPPLFDGPTNSESIPDSVTEAAAVEQPLLHSDSVPDSPQILASIVDNGGGEELPSGLETQLVEILPPPEKSYDSELDAIAALHSWTKDHGFNVTKRRAFYTKTTPRAVWKRGFDCDRAGNPSVLSA
ncbi:hypothetical protein JG687_00000437 [Phytophthora cactorum]|uniref:Uncharacterized protein n=1 Tax=Phytophthora cactorum TaxID=29920 RepID=A0A8T1V058_9STRA|nr:hypothetical protein PC120_g6186 [Phytophthora cactorum]KAG3103619.1 hypothetical protein PC121_g956 [Phytophthora cactorum]KAG4061416.1 hypothetical protein PC123_g3702 [Phytophthora cactorum]KAG6974290.1 hypothetical protein JG687_00000437 [Phytophthora cactorum]